MLHDQKREELKCSIIEQIDNPKTIRDLIKRFVAMTMDKPSQDLSLDEEAVFTFLLRYSVQCSSLWNLLFPAAIKEFFDDREAKPIPDIASTATVIRSMYESFLTLVYLTDANTSASERRFRYLLLQRNAEQLRMKFCDYFGSADALRIPVEQALGTLTRQVREHEYFESAGEKKRKIILKKKTGRLLDWSEIASVAGIDSKYHRSLYGFLCAWAHCDAMSLQQLVAGSWEPQLAQLRTQFVIITGLLLNYAKLFLFSSQISDDVLLETVMDFGTGFVDSFGDPN